MSAIEETALTLDLLQQDIQPALDYTDPNAVVETDDDRRGAEDLLIVLRQAYKTAEEKRVAITRPLDETKKRVMDLFRPHLARLDTLIGVLSLRLSEYQLAKQRAAQEAQDLVLQQEADRVREARANGEFVTPTVLLAEAVPEIRKTSHANLGSVTYREVLDIRIVNASLIPRDLLLPDMVKIRARVQSGAQVPGVAVVKRMVAATRAGR